MTRLRRALGPIAVTWLLFQVATVTAVPVVLWSGSSDELLACTCTHGDHAICPMHHKPAPGSEICLMGSANSPDTAVLTSLFTVGLIGEPPQVSAPSSTSTRVGTHRTTPSLRPAPPDPPPPRA